MIPTRGKLRKVAAGYRPVKPAAAIPEDANLAAYELIADTKSHLMRIGINAHFALDTYRLVGIKAV
jgi:hypothetical protein